MLGNSPCVVKFAEVLFFESDRERLNWFAGHFAHQSDDRARIDATGEKRPQWHLRHQTYPHRVTQNLDSTFTSFFFADSDLFREVRLPIALGCQSAIFPAQCVTRFELSDCLVGSQRSGYTHEREIMIEGMKIYVATKIGMKK